MRNIDEISKSDVVSYLKKRRGILDGVCITGGEPLLQQELSDFIKEVKDLGFLIKLDTNGAFPDALFKILSEGNVDYVAMDLKNSPEKYPLTCGFKDKPYKEFYAPFRKSIEILKTGKIDFEFRTTVVPELHALSDIEKMGEEIRGAKRWYLQSFKDSGDLIRGPFTEPTLKFMQELKSKAENFAVLCEIRGM